MDLTMASDYDMNFTPLPRAKPRFKTAFGRLESRTNARVSSAVMQRWSSELRPFYPPGAYATISPASPSSHQPEPVDRIETWTERVWVSVPDRSRIEGFDPQGRAFSIIVGTQSWMEYTAFGQRIGGERSLDPADRFLNTPHRETALALLEPWRLVHGYALRPTGEVEVSGRPGLCFQGTPTYDAQSVYESGGDDEPFVFVGAEATEFVVDVEWGVLLSWSGFVDGSVYSRTIVTALAFNDVLDDQLFDPSREIGWRGGRGHPP